MRQIDWYRFQVKESKLSMRRTSIGDSRPGGKVTLDELDMIEIFEMLRCPVYILGGNRTLVFMDR